jgi:hypothetical protein
MLLFGQGRESIRLSITERSIIKPLDSLFLFENFAAEQSPFVIVAVNNPPADPTVAKKLDGARETPVVVIMVMEDVEDTITWLHVLFPERHSIDFNQGTSVRIREFLNPFDRLAFRIKALELDNGVVRQLNENIGSPLLSSLDRDFPKWFTGLNRRESQESDGEKTKEIHPPRLSRKTSSGNPVECG